MDYKLYTKLCDQAMSLGRWTETEMSVIIWNNSDYLNYAMVPLAALGRATRVIIIRICITD